MKKKLLIIDDDERMRDALLQFFTGDQFVLFTAADGPQGVSLFRQHHPDVVLLDIGLPTMGGMDVLRAMRTMNKAAKVIILTGFSSLEWVDRAKRNGAYGFHFKTSDYEDLRHTVNEALGIRPGATSGPKTQNA